MYRVILIHIACVWFSVTAQVLNDRNISQSPSKACRHVGESVTLSCEIKSANKKLASCISRWYRGPSGREVQVSTEQGHGPYCMQQDMGAYSFLKISNLQVQNDSVTYRCRMECNTPGKLYILWGNGTTVEIKDPSKDQCMHSHQDSLTKVIQHPSTPQRKPGDFVILYCAINLRQERVKTCKFTWFVIGPNGARSEFFPAKTQQYGDRLFLSQNGGHYITLLLGDLQLNDSGTYICTAKCTVDCEPWSADGNGTALLVADYHSGRVTQGGSNLSALKWQYALLILNALVLCVVLAISVSMCRKLSKKTALCGFSQAPSPSAADNTYEEE